MVRKHNDREIMVIIPVYNCKNYLRQAVESVISQPYRAIKILLVDDGSTDGSAVLCDELVDQDKRITVIHQKNGGVSAARNSGLEYIFSDQENESDYVTFLDADDEWAVNWIDVHINRILKQDYDLIGFQSCTCNDHLTRRSAAYLLQEGEYRGGVYLIWIQAESHMGAMLYRTSMIKQYGIRFQNIKASEDKIFSMQCLYLANEIYLINQLMYLYRQNATSAVHMRARGIPYFVPIIDAYIQLDAEMKRWENDVRGSFHEGRVLAKIYIMDMIEEEWEKSNGTKRIAELLAKRLDYQESLEKPTSNKTIDDRWGDMQKDRRKLIIKNRIHGFLFRIARKVYYIPLVKTYIDRKRYPIKM